MEYGIKFGAPAIGTSVTGDVMGVKGKKADIITVPEKELRDYLYIENWIDVPPEFGEIKEVELIDDRIQFSFCFTQPWSNWKKFQGVRPAEVKRRLETRVEEWRQKALRGEISLMDATEKMGQDMHDSGIKVIALDEDYIFTMIYNMRFPSFWKSFFKLEYWGEVGFHQKFTKVELTNDGVEFTIVTTT